MQCIVLDVDPSKRIADLSEKLTTVKTKSAKPQVNFIQKAIVELNKDQYLIVSMKSSRKTLGICMANNFNNDSLSPESFSIGDEIEVLVTDNSSNLLQLIQSVKKEAKKSTESRRGSEAVELTEGIRF